MSTALTVEHEATHV